MNPVERAERVAAVRSKLREILADGPLRVPDWERRLEALTDDEVVMLGGDMIGFLRELLKNRQ